MHTNKEKAGFTIVELLVVIAIIILMVGASIPAITAFTKGKSMDNAGRIIQTVLMEARRATVTKKVPHRVVFFSRQNDSSQIIYGLKIYRNSTPYDTAKDKGGYMEREYMLPEGITVKLYYTNSSNTAFEPKDGAGPPDEKQFKSDSDPTPFQGKLEFQKSGTILYGGDFKDVPSFDLEHLMKDGDAITNANMTADIVITQDQSNKRCYIDLMPSVGRAYVRVLNLTK